MTTGTVDKKKVRNFIEAHPVKRASAARITYSLYVKPELEAAASKLAEVQHEDTEENRAHRAMIEEASTAEALVGLMRKQLCAVNRDILRIKLLKYEEELLPLMQEKLITNLQDIFIENAIYFLMRCKTNCSAWIMEKYEEFRSEYLKSMLCLVLGIRGEIELIPFLMQENERFLREYPQESYEQATILAVQELYVRFFRS